MGRRSLRKTDPSLDLSRYLRAFEELPRPWDPRRLFGRWAPLEVEVGSGKGLFLRTAAAQRPETDFLGIEIALKYARHAAAGLAKRNLTNAAVAVADAARLFAELLPDESVAAVHLYFPDPWWKKRHKKRRLIREPFVRDIQRVLIAGGVLHFWTDVEEYFRTGLELLSTCTDLQGPGKVPERPAEHDLDYQTHFERRMRKEQLVVHRTQFRKRAV